MTSNASTSGALAWFNGRRLAVFLVRYGMFFALALWMIAMSLSSEYFLTWTNLLNVSRQAAPIIIIGVGGGIVIGEVVDVFVVVVAMSVPVLVFSLAAVVVAATAAAAATVGHWHFELKFRQQRSRKRRRGVAALEDDAVEAGCGSGSGGGG